MAPAQICCSTTSSGASGWLVAADVDSLTELHFRGSVLQPPWLA